VERAVLSLTFVDADGSVLEVSDGDGYTAIVGGEANFHGYLPPTDLIAVTKGAFTGRLTNVRHVRFGYKVADFFGVSGVDERRIGASEPLCGAQSRGWNGSLPTATPGSPAIPCDPVDRAPAFSTQPS
jgi:hypothetical protein